MLSCSAEYPLHWLGEFLIHQSLLYEGNPDQTKIRERFLYSFEDPKPALEHGGAQVDAVAATTRSTASPTPGAGVGPGVHAAVEAERDADRDTDAVMTNGISGVVEVESALAANVKENTKSAGPAAREPEGSGDEDTPAAESKDECHTNMATMVHEPLEQEDTEMQD